MALTPLEKGQLKALLVQKQLVYYFGTQPLGTVRITDVDLEAGYAYFERSGAVDLDMEQTHMEHFRVVPTVSTAEALMALNRS